MRFASIHGRHVHKQLGVILIGLSYQAEIAKNWFDMNCVSTVFARHDLNQKFIRPG